MEEELSSTEESGEVELQSVEVPVYITPGGVSEMEVDNILVPSRGGFFDLVFLLEGRRPVKRGYLLRREEADEEGNRYEGFIVFDFINNWKVDTIHQAVLGIGLLCIELTS